MGIVLQLSAGDLRRRLCAASRAVAFTRRPTAVITSGSVRRLCWPPPFGGYLPSSSRRHRDWRPHRGVRRRDAPPSIFHLVTARSARSSAWRARRAATGEPRQAPDTSRRRLAGSELRLLA